MVQVKQHKKKTTVDNCRDKKTHDLARNIPSSQHRLEHERKAKGYLCNNAAHTLKYIRIYNSFSASRAYISFLRRALCRARRFFACSSTTRYDSDAIRAVCIHPAASIPKAAQHSNAIGDPAFNTGRRSATDSLPCRDGESWRLQRRSTCGWTSRRTNRSARPRGLEGTTSSRDGVPVSSITATESVRSSPCAACRLARLAEVLSSLATAPPASCWRHRSTHGATRGETKTANKTAGSSSRHPINWFCSSFRGESRSAVVTWRMSWLFKCYV